ncbi:hypothetical protein H0H93_000662 [Arthromyces matolae]|nr:hypothetical protein H0H93_000662 [Arthromyces matolae]
MSLCKDCIKCKVSSTMGLPKVLTGNRAKKEPVQRKKFHCASVKLELKPVLSLEDIPTRVAVHGTTQKAWELIAQNGLSKMTRNHIHLAQGVPGDGVISGMRKTSQVLIYIDVQKALDAGLKFFLSDNGVVLSEGINGIILPEFFSNVQDVHGKEIPGWKAAINPPSSS